MNQVQAEVYSGGNLISSSIYSVDIVKEVNRIPYAQIVLCDVDTTDETNKSVIELSNDLTFKPGVELEVSLKQGQNSGSFKGLVIKQKLKKTREGAFLTVEIKDSAFKLCSQRNSVVFTNKDDCQIIKDIASLKGLTVTSTEQTFTHKQIVQYYCTDWDFIISRAEANGLLVFVDNGDLTVKKPLIQNAANELGNIYEFEMEVDAGAQFTTYESVYWDIKTAKQMTGANTNTADLESGLESQLDFGAVSQSMSTDKYRMVSGVHGEVKEMELWANAGMVKNRLSAIRGRVSTDGNPKIKLGDTIKVSEVGNLFNCKTLVTGIRHRISKDGWKTDLQCGLSREWFHKKTDIEESMATGQLPGVHGLQIGIVEAFPSAGDPDGLYRIKLKIPAIDDLEGVIWARLLFSYAGVNRGVFFVPELGDEVVIGFFNDDPRHAVVLGSLYNGTAEPPLQFTDQNSEKGIITKNGIKILFTDEEGKEVLKLATPAGNEILLEDENGIQVVDSNENKVTFGEKGVELVDKNKNKFTLDDKGIIAEDTNKNSITTSKQGIEIKDANGNTITLNDSGVEIKDMNGNKAVLEGGGVTVETSSAMKLKGSTIDLN